MSIPFAIGIDLGTSTSEVCVYRNGQTMVVPDPASPGRSPVIPSLVAVNRRGELVVGEDARPYIHLSGAGVREVKRLMGSGQTVSLGGKSLRPEEISALILRKLKLIAEEALGSAITDVVLSVPANFPDAARQATLHAGELAGLNILRLINEPTAAALAFGIQNIDAEEQLVVFDFGGGTLDITVLEMMAGVLDVKCSFGDTQLGGKDFDEALIALILRKFQQANPHANVSERARLSLKDAAEKAKISLSTQQSYMVQLANFGVSGGSTVDLDVEVTRAEFETAVAPLLIRARECVKQALNAKKIRPSAIDRILLVGGTTYIPCVRKLVAEMFGKEPKADVNPDLAVAIGASVQAALAKDLVGGGQGIILTDVCPFGLGLEVVSSVGSRQMLIYDPLILPNTTIPYSTKRNYHLMYANQEQVEVRLLQDHRGIARVPADAEDTGIEAKIPDIPPAADGTPHQLEVEFSYDINGTARLNARIPRTGQRVQLTFSPSAMRMDEEDLGRARVRVEDLWKKTPKTRAMDGILNKAKQLLPTVSEATAERLRTLIADLERTLATNDGEQIQAAGDKLTDLLFDIENGKAE